MTSHVIFHPEGPHVKMCPHKCTEMQPCLMTSSTRRAVSSSVGTHPRSPPPWIRYATAGSIYEQIKFYIIATSLRTNKCAFISLLLVSVGLQSSLTCNKISVYFFSLHDPHCRKLFLNNKKLRSHLMQLGLVSSHSNTFIATCTCGLLSQHPSN